MLLDYAPGFFAEDAKPRSIVKQVMNAMIESNMFQVLAFSLKSFFNLIFRYTAAEIFMRAGCFLAALQWICRT